MVYGAKNGMCMASAGTARNGAYIQTSRDTLPDRIKCTSIHGNIVAFDPQLEAHRTILKSSKKGNFREAGAALALYLGAYGPKAVHTPQIAPFGYIFHDTSKADGAVIAFGVFTKDEEQYVFGIPLRATTEDMNNFATTMKNELGVRAVIMRFLNHEELRDLIRGDLNWKLAAEAPFFPQANQEDETYNRSTIDLGKPLFIGLDKIYKIDPTSGRLINPKNIGQTFDPETGILYDRKTGKSTGEGLFNPETGRIIKPDKNGQGSFIFDSATGRPIDPKTGEPTKILRSEHCRLVTRRLDAFLERNNLSLEFGPLGANGIAVARKIVEEHFKQLGPKAIGSRPEDYYSVLQPQILGLDGINATLGYIVDKTSTSGNRYPIAVHVLEELGCDAIGGYAGITAREKRTDDDETSALDPLRVERFVTKGIGLSNGTLKKLIRAKIDFAGLSDIDIRETLTKIMAISDTVALEYELRKLATARLVKPSDEFSTKDQNKQAFDPLVDLAGATALPSGIWVRKMVELADKRYAQLKLGGSETLDADTFKASLGAEASPTYWAVYSD